MGLGPFVPYQLNAAKIECNYDIGTNPLFIVQDLVPCALELYRAGAQKKHQLALGGLVDQAVEELLPRASAK